MKIEKVINSINFSTVLSFAKKFDINPKIMEILTARGYDTEEKINNFLHPENIGLHDAFLLNNMKEAVERIKTAIKNNEKVLIFGDYDVDGMCATAIMIKMFKQLGLKVSFYLPNRFKDGYGLTNEVIDKLVAKQKPNLIITVDCGISCHDVVEYVKSKNIDIIITDHHEIPDIIPNTTVINPKLNNQLYPFKDLCGAGVALKVAQAVLGELNYNELITIASIATIADIVSLTDENRYIVKTGLKLMPNYLPIGLKTMFADNKISLNTVTSTEIAFKISPKLNSSGRMGNAQDSLILFLEKDKQKITNLLQKINSHNQKRQKLCNDVYYDCKNKLKKYNLSQIRAILLYSNNWDQGILGIVCARLLEEYHRPVFLFTKIGNELKGSARSIPNVNIHNMLNSMQEIITTFGGHSMAAGLTLDIKNFNEFSKKINTYIKENINESYFQPIKYYDQEIKNEDLTTNFIDQLKLFEPTGFNNHKPIIKYETEQLDVKPLKNFPQHSNIILDNKINCMYFNCSDEYVKLKVAKRHLFLLEIQDNASLKFTVRGYSCFDEYNTTFDSYINSISLNQFAYNTNKKPIYNMFNQEQISNFIDDTNKSVFGTAFVCFNTQTYENFVKNYDMTNIFDKILINDEKSTGFNTVFLSPISLEYVKHFNKIIFLDAIFDDKYISEINKLCSAKIFVVNKKPNNIFNRLMCERNQFAQTYITLEKVDGCYVNNIHELYEILCKKHKYRYDFQNFYFHILVFKDMQVCSFILEDAKYKFNILNKQKSNLTSSSIYNKLLLLNKVTEHG